MQLQTKQIHLCLPGMSGRGVRFRQLTATQAREAKYMAVRGLADNASGYEAASRQWVAMVKRMLVSVTDQEGIEPSRDPDPESGDPGCAGLMAEGVTWHELTLEQLETVKGEWSYDALFTTRDDDMLQSICREENGLSEKDVKDIMGKALPVAAP